MTAAERRQAREALGLAASVDSIEEEDEEEEWEPETVWHTIRYDIVSATTRTAHGVL